MNARRAKKKKKWRKSCFRVHADFYKKNVSLSLSFTRAVLIYRTFTFSANCFYTRCTCEEFGSFLDACLLFIHENNVETLSTSSPNATVNTTTPTKQWFLYPDSREGVQIINYFIALIIIQMSFLIILSFCHSLPCSPAGERIIAGRHRPVEQLTKQWHTWTSSDTWSWQNVKEP